MPLLSTSSLASNVAQVRPMQQHARPPGQATTTTVTSSSAPTSTSTPPVKYQNVNVTINGVVKSLLIPMAEQTTGASAPKGAPPPVITLTPDVPTITLTPDVPTSTAATRPPKTVNVSPAVMSVPPSTKQVTPSPFATPTSVTPPRTVAVTPGLQRLLNSVGPGVIKLPAPYMGPGMGATQQVRQGTAGSGRQTSTTMAPPVSPPPFRPNNMISLPADMAGMAGNNVILKVPDPKGGPHQYIFVQQQPVRSSTPASTPTPTYDWASKHVSTVNVSPQNPNSLLKPDVGKTTTVVFPLGPSGAAAPTPLTAVPQRTTAAKTEDLLKIDSIFSLGKRGSAKSNLPSGVIEIKPEPEDSYRYSSGVVGSKPGSQQPSTTISIPWKRPTTVRSKPSPTNEDFVVLAEWDAGSEGTLTTKEAVNAPPDVPPKLLGPKTARSNALLKSFEKGSIAYPKIKYARPQPKRPQYRIKRSTIELQKLACFIKDEKEYLNGKTFVGATELEIRILAAKQARIEKRRKRRKENKMEHAAKEGRNAMARAKSDAICSAAFAAQDAQTRLLQNPVPTFAAAGGKPGMMPLTITAPTQAVSVDKKKYLMVKTAAGSFLVPVTPGPGAALPAGVQNFNKGTVLQPVGSFSADKVGQPSARSSMVDKVGQLSARSSTADKVGQPSAPPPLLKVKLEPGEPSGVSSSPTAQPATPSVDRVTEEPPAKVARVTESPPEENLSREERIKRLKERLKKQREETESAQRLHAESKSALETIDMDMA